MLLINLGFYDLIKMIDNDLWVQFFYFFVIKFVVFQGFYCVVFDNSKVMIEGVRLLLSRRDFYYF